MGNNTSGGTQQYYQSNSGGINSGGSNNIGVNSGQSGSNAGSRRNPHFGDYHIYSPTTHHLVLTNGPYLCQFFLLMYLTFLFYLLILLTFLLKKNIKLKIFFF